MSIDKVIKERKTQKVLANTAWEESQSTEELKKVIEELLDLAAVAPYHCKCDKQYQVEEQELRSCLPFRFYVLKTSTCRELVCYADLQNLELKKLKNMLNAADAVLLVTWLPSSSSQEKLESLPFEGSLINMEHIAASSAAIQNVLIGATSRGIPNYWSSGGALRKNVLRDFLKISMKEVLLGAIFLFPKDIEEREVVIKSGGLRNSGKEKDTWSKWI